MPIMCEGIRNIKMSSKDAMPALGEVGWADK